MCFLRKNSRAAQQGFFMPISTINSIQAQRGWSSVFFLGTQKRGSPGRVRLFRMAWYLSLKIRTMISIFVAFRVFFYIVSDEFLAACHRLNVSIVDSVKIEVLSESRESISSKSYNAVLFEELDVRSNSDPASTFVEENGRPVRFKKLILSDDWKLDLFKYRRLISGSDSLICSQAFKDLAENFKGIAFTPLETVLWSGIRRI